MVLRKEGIQHACTSKLLSPLTAYILACVSFLCYVGGEDYVATTVSLTFRPGSEASPLCAEVRIEDDSLTERSEMFFGQLTTEEAGVSLSPQQATFTIIDNERKYLHLRELGGTMFELSPLGECKNYKFV